jgi:hypothetical protein
MRGANKGSQSRRGWEGERNRVTDIHVDERDVNRTVETCHLGVLLSEKRHGSSAAYRCRKELRFARMLCSASFHAIVREKHQSQ